MDEEIRPQSIESGLARSKNKVYPVFPVKKKWWKTQNRKRLLEKLKHFWSSLSFT